MRIIQIDIKVYLLVFLFLLLLMSATALRADADETVYKLAGLALCLNMKDAKNILDKEGFVYQNEKFIKITGNVRQIVSLETNTSLNETAGLVTAIEYVERGQYSPVDIGNMIDNEKKQFEKLYGKPTGCDSDVATVFAFSCYYGDKQQSTPLLTISANRKGKRHSLTIKECGTKK